MKRGCCGVFRGWKFVVVDGGKPAEAIVWKLAEAMVGKPGGVVEAWVFAGLGEEVWLF